MAAMNVYSVLEEWDRISTGMVSMAGLGAPESIANFESGLDGRIAHPQQRSDLGPGVVTNAGWVPERPRGFRLSLARAVAP